MELLVMLSLRIFYIQISRVYTNLKYVLKYDKIGSLRLFSSSPYVMFVTSKKCLLFDLTSDKGNSGMQRRSASILC